MISDRGIDRLRCAAAWPELDARYEVTGIAGYGGMCTVYVARDHVLARDVAERLALFARILEAVALAHAHGIVHRDLTPENVMVGGFGEVYVMDWGVAQDGAADVEPAVVGTPGFMPPEQEQGASVDHRADVFALGAMLEQLIGDYGPAALRAIAMKARDHDANARYQSAESLAMDLARLRSQDPVEAYRESSAERIVRIYRRYELPILLLLAYVVMRFVLLVWRGV